MRIHYLLSAAILVTVGACGGGSGGPASPGPGPTQTLGSITVTPTSFTLASGGIQKITVTGTDTDGRNIANLTGVTLTSQNPAVADVVSGGDVIGVTAGSTTINVAVSFGGVTKTASVAATVTGTPPLTASVAAGVAANTFTPQTVVIARTGSVTWSFGAVEHNVTFGSTSGAPTNILNVANTTVTKTFNTAGNFSYDCTIHAGMTGVVLVR